MLRSTMSLLLLVVIFSLCLTSDASKLPGLFVFGDSTVDTGNLKHRSLSFLMSNSLPYGRDFVPPGPTGRASNGKLSVDFIAEFLELPYPACNVDAKPETSTQGVNFAVGGSGYLNDTGAILGSTVSLSQQLDNFQKFVQSYTMVHGQAKASDYISKSLFVVSSGNNDMFNYLYNIGARLQYSAKSYNNLVLSHALSHIQRLYSLGARRILVTSIGPLGCTPGILTIYNSNGACVQDVNTQVKNFNSALQASLKQLRGRLTGATLLYGDAYDLLLDAIQQPRSHNFRYGNDACCGLGKFHGSAPCGNTTTVCSVSDEHVFWDLVHPTQGMYHLVSNSLISGPVSQVSPMNLQQLVAHAGNV